MAATPILDLSSNLRFSSPPQTPEIGPGASPVVEIGPDNFAPQSPPSHRPDGLNGPYPCPPGFSTAELSGPEGKDFNDNGDQPESPIPPATRRSDAGEPAAYRTRIPIETSLVIEELSDFDDDDMQGRDDVLRPSAIEYAESERSKSRTRVAPDDPRMIDELQNLNCRSPDPPDPPSGSESDISELDDHEATLRRIRAENRRQRMSQSSVGTKRTISERGSDGDDSNDRGERSFVGFEEAGSSARRLRRRVGDKRVSLTFPDPPPRIDEVPEELSLEETETLARELPFYEYSSMEVDSPRSSSW